MLQQQDSPKLRLDLVFNDFVANGITKNKILILSDGKQWRPLIHVKDMSRAISWSIEYLPKKNYLAINVGSEKWTFTIRKLAQIVAKELGNVEVKIHIRVNLIKEVILLTLAYLKN